MESNEMIENCDCIKRISNGVIENVDNAISASILQLELLSGRTYTDFEVEINGRKKPKIFLVLHSYCPFCGTKYNKIKQDGEIK